MKFITRHALALAFYIASATAGSLVIHSNETSQYERERERSAQQVAFLLTAGGEDSFAGISVVANQLGQDIDEWVEEGRDIEDFRAVNSNRYGGITDAIGYDPFDETGLNCEECGPLDAETIDHVKAVRDNGTVNVTVPVAPEATNWGLHALETWVVGGPVSLLVAMGWQFIVVSRREARTSISNLPAASKVLTGPTYLPLGWYLKYKSKANERKLRAAFPEQMRTLDDVNRAVAALEVQGQSTRLEALIRMRDGVLDGMTHAVKSPYADPHEIDALMQRLQESRVWVDARSDYLRNGDKELNPSEGYDQ